jgi:hypothetical protein
LFIILVHSLPFVRQPFVAFVHHVAKIVPKSLLVTNVICPFFFPDFNIFGCRQVEKQKAENDLFFGRFADFFHKEQWFLVKSIYVLGKKYIYFRQKVYTFLIKDTYFLDETYVLFTKNDSTFYEKR